MTILRAAALAAIIAWAGVAHADGRRRYHDEAGVVVGLGIFADALGASILADLIAPSSPEVGCVGYVAPGYPPYGYTPPVDIGTRRTSDDTWVRPWW